MAYALNQHEYQVFSGGAWSASRQTNMVQLSDGRHRITGLSGSYATGQVRVRVMALGSNPPSDWLYNNAPFTAEAANGNILPVAYAGQDNVITLPTTSTALSGSGTDADGTVVSFAWRQIEGPRTGTFNSKTVATPTVSDLTVAGEYTFGLKVTDNQSGVSAEDIVVVTVNPAPVNYTDRVNIVMSGNSIVFGYNADTSYPEVMRSLLPSNYTVTNIGKSGWNITQINGQRAEIEGLYDTRSGAVNLLMCQEGINSFAQGQSVDDYFALYNDFLGYFRNHPTQDWKVVGVTPTPYNYYANGVPAMQQDLIARMQAQRDALYDGLLDWSPNPRVGYFTPYNSAAFSEWFPDNLHPSTQAQRLMGRMAYDLINQMFNGVPLPDQSKYPTDIAYAGAPIEWSTDRYQVVVTDYTVNSQPGISQRNNWIYSAQQMTAGDGLRGFNEFSLNGGAAGFVGISQRTGQVQAGQQTIALQVDNGGFTAWTDFINNLGQVGGWAPGARVRMEVYSNKVAWYLNNSPEPFYTWNGNPVFPCRFCIIPDGGGYYYNVRQG